MITRQELNESLERFMNNVLLGMKQHFEHTDVQFGLLRDDVADIRARLDRNTGLLEPIAARLESRP
jgi:hypothetical protein